MRQLFWSLPPSLGPALPPSPPPLPPSHKLAIRVTQGKGVRPPLLEHGALVLVGPADGNQAQPFDRDVAYTCGVQKVVLALGKEGREGGREGGRGGGLVLSPGRRSRSCRTG